MRPRSARPGVMIAWPSPSAPTAASDQMHAAIVTARCMRAHGHAKKKKTSTATKTNSVVQAT